MLRPAEAAAVSWPATRVSGVGDATARVRALRSVPRSDDRRPGYADLIAGASNRDDPMVLALAGVIGLAPLRAPPYDVSIAGLDATALTALAGRWFARLPAGLVLGGGSPAVALAGGDEFADLVTLLGEHRTRADAESHWLACAVATACMEGNHLWQDMGLPNRDVLSALLATYFAPLAARNTDDMKWKKFFYRELCQRAGVPICKAPVCRCCVDFPKCFGPEV
jgi:nitrogen fixation protein NifQ